MQYHILNTLEKLKQLLEWNDFYKYHFNLMT